MTHHRSIRAYLGAGVVLAMTASFAAGTAIAQSPVPSGAPASAAPASPAGSPEASTSPADAAKAACDAILTSDSITSVTGATVTSEDPHLVSNGNFDDSPFCSWVLSDGSSIAIATMYEYGRQSGNIDKALVVGDAKVVDSLPKPNAGVVYSDGSTELLLGRVGPLLVETLDFRGTGADGKPIGLPLLEQLAQASVAQLAPPPVIDAACTTHLNVPVVSSEGYSAPSSDGENTDDNCGYDFGDGTTARLSLRWESKAAQPDCCDKVKELGKGAFAVQQGTDKKAPWRIQWVIQPGDPGLIGTIEDGGTSTKHLSKQEFIALAKQVTVGPVVVANPTPPITGTGASAEAAALLGSWSLVPTGDVSVPKGLTVTLTFGTDGTVVMAFDCKPPKKKRALSWSGGYTADATTLDVTWSDRFQGACKDPDASNFSQPMSFILSLFTHPGGWEVVGDTLNLMGSEGPMAGKKLPFQRVAP